GPQGTARRSEAALAGLRVLRRWSRRWQRSGRARAAGLEERSLRGDRQRRVLAQRNAERTERGLGCATTPRDDLGEIEGQADPQELSRCQHALRSPRPRRPPREWHTAATLDRRAREGRPG